MNHRRLVTTLARRRLKADWHANRLGGSLATLVSAERAALLDSLPDNPHRLDAYRLADHAAATAWRLRAALRSRLRAGLGDLIGYTHAQTAKTLTQRVRGTLPVRAVKREMTSSVKSGLSLTMEAWTDYLDDYSEWILDPPTADLLARLVGPAPDMLTRLIDPQEASRVVLDGIAGGKDRRQIAADLSDVFGGYEVAARRVARTEGLRVSCESALAASEQISGLIPAYQVLAVLDTRTRPDHRKRSGTVYYRRPVRGQLGFADMPRPPIEPDGTVSWNCRCLLVACFDPDSDDVKGAGALVYDWQTGHVR